MFSLAAVILIFSLNWELKDHALEEARIQARIILNRNLAIHAYYSHQLKPQLLNELEGRIAQGYFDPSWMSSTFAIREINKLSKNLDTLDYYYKECAINARSPENEADPYERSFIQRLNADPRVTELAKVRTLQGKPYFDLLRRGETMEASCLRCHLHAEIAPLGLVQRYGPSRSFGRVEGEVVSAVSIRIPLEHAYAEADQVSLHMSVGLLLVLLVLYALQLWLHGKLVFAPLGRVSRLAEQIAGNARRLGEIIPVAGGRDLRELTDSFNAMSTGLRQNLDQLQRTNLELSHSEERYHSLLDSIQAAVVVHDAATRILISNPLAQEMLGLGEEQLRGMRAEDPAWQFCREDGSPLPIAEYPVSQVLAGGRSLRNQVIGLRRLESGGQLWVLVNADPVFGDKDEVRQVIVTFVDLTERRRVEQRLELLEYALNHVGEAAFLADEQARLHYVNAEACRRLGYRREDLLHLGVADVDPDCPVECWTNRLRESRQVGTLRFESRHRTRDGEIFPVEVSTSFFKYEGQGYLLALARDISERKHNERLLQEKEVFIRNILDTVDEGFIVVDREQRILAANRAFCNFVGRAEGLVLGQFCHQVSPLSTVPCFEAGTDCAARRSFETGRPQAATHQHRDAAGELRVVELKTYPVVDAEGLVQTVIETFSDVSERQKLEEQLRQSQKLESVGQLAGGVAHDFNNMLGVILGRTQMALAKVPADQPLHAGLLEIHKAAERSAELTRQLLAFARKQVIAPRIIDLDETLAGMLKMLRRLIGEDIELFWEPGGNRLQVNMDPSQVDQILVNLCVNARDGIGGQGKIFIATQRVALNETNPGDHGDCPPGEYVLLSIADNGRGMDKKVLARIFEPFFTTKGVGRGTGLGLATVYGIVKQNKGFISVRSELGKGTKFELYLPLCAEERVSADRNGRVKMIAGGNETILLVEDEPSILSMTRQLLAEFGYKVLIAKNPSEALQIARTTSGEIHLLLTDLVMPGMHGRELAEKIGAEYPYTSILFMSGYPATELKGQKPQNAGDNFIQKPFSLEQLGAKVREVLDKRLKFKRSPF
jgi:PAS domain S-box-containing protein